MASTPMSSDSHADNVSRQSYGSVPELSPSAEPTRSRTSSALASRVAELPDLTDRLKEAGILAEYHAYRTRYLSWRRGGSQGAQGELTARTLQDYSADPYKFEYWYPTASIFKWRFTTAYWIAILYLIGAILFTFSSALSYLHGPGGTMIRRWPNVIGAFCFSFAAYFAYLQLINMGADMEKHVSYLFPDCDDLPRRIGASSAVGTIAYFLGAMFFQVGMLTEFCPFEDSTSKFYLNSLPNLLGGMGFVLGGFCELVHNRIFQGGATSAEPVWWAALANNVGDVLFFLACVPDAVGTIGPWRDDFVDICFCVGSFMFVISSILMLVMWRVNDFGLTLLNQLNFALKRRGYVGVGQLGVRLELPEDEDQGPRGFSTRAATFIVIYCWFASVAIVNCLCKHIWYERATEPHSLQHVLDLGMQIFVVCVILIILLVHSVVTEVPMEQPYHFALIASRLILVCGAVIQTAITVTFLAYPGLKSVRTMT